MGRPRKDSSQQTKETISDLSNYQGAQKLLQHKSTCSPNNTVAINSFIGEPLMYMPQTPQLTWNKLGSFHQPFSPITKPSNIPLDMRVFQKPSNLAEEKCSQIKMETNKDDLPTYRNNKEVKDTVMHEKNMKWFNCCHNVKCVGKESSVHQGSESNIEETQKSSDTNGLVPNGSDSLSSECTSDSTQLRHLSTVPWVNNVGIAEANSVFKALIQAEHNRSLNISDILTENHLDNFLLPHTTLKRREYLTKKYPVTLFLPEVIKFWDCVPFDLNPDDALTPTDVQHIENLCIALKDMVEPMDISNLNEQTINNFRVRQNTFHILFCYSGLINITG